MKWLVEIDGPQALVMEAESEDALGLPEQLRAKVQPMPDLSPGQPVWDAFGDQMTYVGPDPRGNWAVLQDHKGHKYRTAWRHVTPRELA